MKDQPSTINPFHASVFAAKQNGFQVLGSFPADVTFDHPTRPNERLTIVRATGLITGQDCLDDGEPVQRNALKWMSDYSLYHLSKEVDR